MDKDLQSYSVKCEPKIFACEIFQNLQNKYNINMFRHYGSYLFICYLICLILEKCKSISKPEIMRFRFELG